MKKKFVLSWIGNLGSGIVQMGGSYDEATKALNMSGKQSVPGMKKETAMRQVLTFHNDDSYTMAMYGTGHDGKEAKFMEGSFKRTKKYRKLFTTKDPELFPGFFIAIPPPHSRRHIVH